MLLQYQTTMNISFQESDVLDLIVLRRVRRVERVSEEGPCLKVETTHDKTFYFIFNSDKELYSWLTDIHHETGYCGEPTDFAHVLHVVPDKTDNQRLIVSDAFLL
jgi:hypothetical protein